MSVALLDEPTPQRGCRATGRRSSPAAERAASIAVVLTLAGVAASVKIALANILLGAAAVAWLLALSGGAVRWRRARLWPAALAWIAATLAAVVLSRDPVASARETAELATLLLLPMVVTLLDRRRWDRLLAALAAVASASAAVGLGQYLAGASDLAHRLRGLTTHYMTFSGWTLVVTLLLAADAAFHPDRRRRRWTVPAAALCTVALLLSFTRNAWVGLAAGLALAALLWRPRALLLLPSVALVAGAALPHAVRARAVSIFDLREPSNHDRVCMIRSGLEMVAARPVAGVGMGMVEPAYDEFRLPSATRDRVPHLHCNPVQIAAERGLLGLAAYLALLGVFAARCRTVLSVGGHPAFPMVAGCLLAVVGVSVAGLFEYNWGDAEVWIVTLVCLAAPFAPAAEVGRPVEGEQEAAT